MLNAYCDAVMHCQIKHPKYRRIQFLIYLQTYDEALSSWGSQQNEKRTGHVNTSKDFSKRGSQCVKVRVLTRLSCRFRYLLWVVCLKKDPKGGGGMITSTPGPPSGYAPD